MEEEEKVPIIESVTSAQKIAKIDTKWIAGKYTEHELMRFVVKRTARERRNNQLGELVRQFQSLIISDDFIDTNWISSNSHLSHLKSLQDTEIQIIKKRKNSRLTDSEKQFIVKQIKQRGYSVKELLKKLGVSDSTVRRFDQENMVGGKDDLKLVWFLILFEANNKEKQTLDGMSIT